MLNVSKSLLLNLSITLYLTICGPEGASVLVVNIQLVSQYHCPLFPLTVQTNLYCVRV